MDLTGSIADLTFPILDTLSGSLGDGIGSSFVDTAIELVFYLPVFLLNIAASAGADLGSTMGGGV